jgi:hypothetical protein
MTRHVLVDDLTPRDWTGPNVEVLTDRIDPDSWSRCLRVEVPTGGRVLLFSIESSSSAPRPVLVPETGDWTGVEVSALADGLRRIGDVMERIEEGQAR